MRLWPTVDHLDPPDLPRQGCNSDRGTAASGGPTVLANDRNGRRLRLNASRHDDAMILSRDLIWILVIGNSYIGMLRNYAIKYVIVNMV